MGFRIELITEFFWRCPICSNEECISLDKKGFIKKNYFLNCNSCGAKWGELDGENMTLLEGPSEQLGIRSMEEWWELCENFLSIKPLNNIELPIFIESGEDAIMAGKATIYVNERQVLLSPHLLDGINLKIRDKINIKASDIIPEYSRKTEAPDDTGEFILTTDRLIFNGNKKILNMNLRNIIAVGVEDGFLEIGYGKTTFRFKILGESVLKWRAYIRYVRALNMNK